MLHTLTCTPNVTLYTQDYVLNLRKCNFAQLYCTPKSQLAHLKECFNNAFTGR